MTYILQGLTLMMSSLGLSSMLLLRQKDLFKDLNYRTKSSDCELVEILDNQIDDHSRAAFGDCWIPDLASHNQENANDASSLLQMAMELCAEGGCDEY